MATYLIGDIHGCYNELKIMLDQVSFDPKTDELWLTGDVIGRGPNSLEVLRLIHNLDNKVRMVLGNHDLHLLSIYCGIHHAKPEDHLNTLLEAPDSNKLIHWLRHQPLLQIDKEKKLIMAHAGISPQWNTRTACACALEIENELQNDNNYISFLSSIYNDLSNNWNNKLNKIVRMQFSVNVFTRMRYCFPNGQLAMKYKDIPDNTPIPLKPWFSLKNFVLEKYNIVFGHWSTLRGKGTPNNIYGLDTGCCWGGKLTSLRWEDKKFFSVPSIKYR